MSLPKLNPASFLPEGEEKPKCSCVEVLMESYALTDQPLDNPDLELYPDGSSFVRQDQTCRIRGGIRFCHDLVRSPTPKH
jgi:hypothetical protein